MGGNSGGRTSVLILKHSPKLPRMFPDNNSTVEDFRAEPLPLHVMLLEQVTAFLGLCYHMRLFLPSLLLS